MRSFLSQIIQIGEGVLPLMGYTTFLLMVGLKWLESGNLQAAVANIKVSIRFGFSSRVAVNLFAHTLYSFGNHRMKLD